MKRHNLSSVCLGIIILLACFPAFAAKTASPEALSCEASVEAMGNLTKDLQIPKYFEQKNCSKTGGEFDVNKYFDALTHLSMQKGYVLDYVYNYQGIGGRPVLYARPVKQPPYKTMADYEKAMGKIPPAEAYNKFLESVQVDDTPEGFFQLVQLEIMGSQFYLFWHANYNDYVITCTQAELEAVLSQKNFDHTIPPKVAKEARKINLEPVIEMGADTVKVEIVVFSKWKGFGRRTYTISRQFPHTIRSVESEVLVPYNCGIMF